jgi:hypothetical protein
MVETWSNGGNLAVDNALFSDPRSEAGLRDLSMLYDGQDPPWLRYQVNDINTLTNSLFGSGVMESFFNVANQPLFKVKGMGVRSMIDSLRSRIDGDKMIPLGKNPDGSVKYGVLSPQEKKLADSQLTQVENQYLVNMGRVPRNLETPDVGQRNILALSRIGTSFLSSPQWALSTIAETTQLFIQGVMRSFIGDFGGMMDFIRPLSKGQRKELYTSVNMFQNQFDRKNIGIKTGLYHLDQMYDLDRTDKTRMEKADDTLRWITLAGFGKITRYNRYVMASRSSRKLKAAASKPRFAQFIDEIGNDGMSTKDIINAGRKAGIPRDVATWMATSGIAGKGNARAVQTIMTDHTTASGVDFDTVNATIENLYAKGQVQEAQALMRGAQQVSGMLQAMNTTINLEPRMGTKSVPLKVTENILSSLSQFPVLAMHNIMRMGRLAGMSGLLAYFMYLMLGDAAYENVKEVLVKGKSLETIKMEWEADPESKILDMLTKTMFAGGGIGNMAKNGLLRMGAEGVGMMDEDFAQGYRKGAFMEKGVDAAGIGMMTSFVGDLGNIFTHLANADYDKAFSQSAAIAPVPMRPMIQAALSMAMGDTVYAHMKDKGSGSHSSSSISKNYNLAAPEGQMRGTTNPGTYVSTFVQDGREAPPEASEAPATPEDGLTAAEPLVGSESLTGKVVSRETKEARLNAILNAPPPVAMDGEEDLRDML